MNGFQETLLLQARKNQITVNGLQETTRMPPRIIVIGLRRISLPVRVEPRQGVISLRTLEKVKEAEVRAEAGAEAEAGERAVVLPTLPLVEEMKKRCRSLVDCRSQHTVFVYTYTHQTRNLNCN